MPPKWSIWRARKRCETDAAAVAEAFPVRAGRDQPRPSLDRLFAEGAAGGDDRARFRWRRSARRRVLDRSDPRAAAAPGRRPGAAGTAGVVRAARGGGPEG